MAATSSARRPSPSKVMEGDSVFRTMLSNPAAGLSRPAAVRLLAAAHRREELGVVLGLAHLRDQQLHRLDRRQRVQHLAEHPDAVEILLGHQELFLARAALL